MNLLDFKRAGPKDKFIYYATNKKNHRIITGFPSKDAQWMDFFFYVPIYEETVGAEGNKSVRTSSQRLDSQSHSLF